MGRLLRRVQSSTAAKATRGGSSRPAAPASGAASRGVVRITERFACASDGVRPGLLGGALRRLELPTAGSLRRACSEIWADPAPGPSNLAVLDVESSGLWGDSFPFMIGVASHEGDGAMRVDQWIATGPAYEADMLRDVMGDLDRRLGVDGRLLTYNGASFDLPLLNARLMRNRSRRRFPPQRDLLTVARRLWRDRYEDCRLTTLERRLLAVRRQDDIEGAEVPEIYGRWLLHGGAADRDDPYWADVLRVAEHNRADLLTLPAIASFVARTLEAPDDATLALAAARHLQSEGNPERAVALAEPWLSGRMHDPACRALGLLVADIHRKAARYGSAEDLWQRLWAAFPGDAEVSDALAKHLEHRRRDLRAALRVAEHSELPCPKRLERLRRRLERTPN